MNGKNKRKSKNNILDNGLPINNYHYDNNSNLFPRASRYCENDDCFFDENESTEAYIELNNHKYYRPKNHSDGL